MVRLDVRNRIDKILLVILAIVLVIALIFIFFTIFLPKEIKIVKIFAISGLFLNFYGTVLLAFTLVKLDKEIKDLVGTYYGGNQNLKKDMLKNRRVALKGLIAIVVGFLFQIIDVVTSY